MSGLIALVGSGEYLESMRDVEAHLLAGRPARYVQLATAAYPDGPERVAYWHDLGRRQAERLGVEQVVVPVGTRDEANDPANVALVRGAGLIYLSGGDPHYLATTLRATPLAEAILDEWHQGASLAGCSAGAMAMTSWVPSLRNPQETASEGLGWLSHLRVIPHFDYVERVAADALTRFLAGPGEATLVGIDEETAMVGDGRHWTVWGRQRVWVITPSGRTPTSAGGSLTTP